MTKRLPPKPALVRSKNSLAVMDEPQPTLAAVRAALSQIARSLADDLYEDREVKA
ncbi:MAG: hypothetical protein K2X03_12185 [Bryobacteraceae bacterium]|nr:hypothetical protein [Bryobacteraceae bacterium]